MGNAASVSIGVSTIVQPDLGRWAQAWDELVVAAPLPTPFSRAWWLESVPQHHPRYVLLVEQGELVGGIALEERVVAGVSFVSMLGAGDLCPDHLDLLARPGYEAVAAAAVRAWLMSTKSRVVVLGGLVAGATVLDAFPDGSSAVEATAPFARLTDADAYLSGRSKNFRSNVRKAAHRADREGLRYRRLDPIETSSGLTRLRELHIARWGDTRFLTSFDRFSAAAMRGAAAGEVSLHELVADDMAVASVVCFELAGRISFYQAGRRPDPQWYSAGTLLLFRIMDHANKRGLHEFDLLRGDESYKLAFADAQRSIVVVRSNWGLRGRAAARATGAVRHARSVGASAKGHIARRMKTAGVAH